MKKVIDILAIVLPALIILLGIIRVFVKKTKGVNGLTMLFAILLLLAGLIRYYVYPDKSSGPSGPKPLPLTVSKHSEAFNQSVDAVLSGYYQMIDGFAKSDTVLISQTAGRLAGALDSLKIDELKVDTLIYQTAVQPYENAKAEIKAVAADPSLVEKRGSLNILSNELFALLSTVRYDRAKLYWQECPAAFGEGKPGNWFSPGEQASSNPYAVNDCMELKTTINFVPADTSSARTP
jgi:hypothetical protein